MPWVPRVRDARPPRVESLELRLCFTSILPASMDEAVKRLARCVGEVRLTA